MKNYQQECEKINFNYYALGNKKPENLISVEL